MLKKLGKFLRVLFIGAVWSIIFFGLLYFLLKWGWKFNIFRYNHWHKIAVFWDAGGTIKTFKEWTFFLILISAVPVWIWGWRKSCKISLIRIIFFPIFWYHDHQEKKYAQMPKSVTLKNMGGKLGAKQSPQQAMEEMIASRMPKEKEKKDLNSSKIRSSFEEKSRTFHEKVEEQQEEN